MSEYLDIQLGAPAQSRGDLLQALLDWTGINDLTGLDVLEVGCGNGIFLGILKEMNPKSLTGLDINPAYTESGHKVLCGEQEKLPFVDKSIDLYISSETMEHSYDHKKAISEMFRVLRNGGKALIGLPWGLKHSGEPIHCSAIPLGLTKSPRDVIKQFKSRRVKSMKYEIVSNGAFEEFRLFLELK